MPAISRLAAYLHRQLSGRQQADGIISIARRAAFAGCTRILRLSRTTALESESFENYCTRIHPARVTSGEALLTGSMRSPRVWALAAPPPVRDHSRIITVDGVKQPWFAITPPTYRSTQQAFLRVRSAIVYPRPGLVMPEPGVVLRNDLLLWVPDHRLTPGFVDFVDGKLVARKEELHPRRHVRGTVLVLCHAFHHNYAHWLFDCLPYLLPWQEPLRQGHMAVLVPPLKDWQRRTLELLGVPASAVLQAPEPSLLCDDMIIPGLISMGVEPISQPKSYHLPQPGPSVVEAIQNLRAGISPKIPSEPPERIYISRRGTESFRCMRNEDEVEAAMIRLGFAVARAEELTLDEQIATFGGVRVIAGPHGAGLTNAAFAPPGCLVVDICVESWAPRWMARATQLFEHHYLPVAFPVEAELSKPLFLGDAIIGQTLFYTVQTDALVATITNAMRSLGIEGDKTHDVNRSGSVSGS